MSRLEGKVALVTGASKGIGAGIAKGLAAAGASVAVNYASDRSSAAAVVAAITASGGRAILVPGDVSKSADVARLFVETKAAYGALDVLVNNAAVYRFGSIATMTEEEFHREFNTNVLGPLLMIREAVKYFGPRGGSIINIGSVATQLTPPNMSIYTATKGALDAITRVLAKELGPRRIRVNSINPGATATEGARAAGLSRRELLQVAAGLVAGTALAPPALKAADEPAVRSIGLSKVMDLTHTLSPKFPIIPIPGLTFPIKITAIATLEKFGVYVNKWELMHHNGTHIDAPSKFIAA